MGLIYLTFCITFVFNLKFFFHRRVSEGLVSSVSSLNVGHVEDDCFVNVAPYSLVDRCFAEVSENPAACIFSADVWVLISP